MAKVYVTQEQDKRDITGALQYGEIEILLPNGHQIMFSPAPTIKRLERKLATFSDNDYILLMGDPAIIGATCMVASQINNGKIILSIYNIICLIILKKNILNTKVNIYIKNI